MPAFRRITAGLACLGLVLALLAYGPGVARAEVSNPFSGVPNPSTTATETATTAASTESSTSSSLSSKKSIVISAIVALVVVLGGIAYLIVRDARRVAPAGEGLGGRAGPDPAEVVRKRRAKAKAARRQRKRNR